VVNPPRRNRNDFFFRIAQRGEFPTKNAASIDVDGAIEPLRLRNRGVAVHDYRRTAIVGGPVVANGQTELVNLAGGLAEQGEVPDFAGAAALHFLLHSGVGDDQAAFVKNIVADESVEKLGDLSAEFRRLFVELRECLGYAVGKPDVAAAKLAKELDVVITRNAVREPWETMCMTRRRTPGEFGPRSVRSPRNTAFRPAGGMKQDCAVGFPLVCAGT